MADLTKAERIVATYWALVEVARGRTTITYGDLASAIDGVSARSVGRYLDIIAVHLFLTERPPLTALAVSRLSGTPGGGWLAVGETFHEACARVYAHDWQHDLFDSLMV